MKSQREEQEGRPRGGKNKKGRKEIGENFSKLASPSAGSYVYYC